MSDTGSLASVCSSPTPSSTTSTTSSNSVFKYDQQQVIKKTKPIIQTQVSNFGSTNTSSSSVFCSSINQPVADDIGTYTVTSTISSSTNERINPFDKNNKVTVTDKRTDSSVTLPYSSSAISTNSLAKGNDDTENKSYEHYTGSTVVTTAPSTTKYSSSILSNDDGKDTKLPSYSLTNTSKEYDSSKYISDTKVDAITTSPKTVPSDSLSKRTEALRDSFASPQYTRSSGSVSDADIIFGNISEGRSDSLDKSRTGSGSTKKYGRDGSNFNTSIDSSGSIFGTSENKRDTYYTNRSMSVSSAKDLDYIYHPNSSATAPSTNYRIYEGIQNDAFSDFDSPSRSSVSSSTSTKKRPTYADDDEYDLK